MKKLLLLAICYHFFTAAIAQSKQQDSVLAFCYFINNGEDGLHLAWSNDGLQWSALKNNTAILKPEAGDDKLLRDPCIIKGADSVFHMVWTVSWKERSIGYASSPDLIHWSAQVTIPVMEHEKEALNCWAPEILYDAASKRYMIYWATTIPGRFKDGDTLGDGKYNHRIYYTLTKDFKKYTPAAILYDKSFNVIDATIQKDGAGYVMFLKDETLKPVAEKNIRIATSHYLTRGYSNPSSKITGNYWAEGPTAIKQGDTWTVYFDKYMNHSYGAVQSTDLVHWTDVSDKIVFPEGTRHGTVFKICRSELELLLKQ